jgi:hypothetical protein
MYDTNKWIISEHPEYLFGKLNLANEYYLKNEFEKMPEILGETMELKALYPECDTFHLSEVVSFLKCAVLYFTATDNIEQAEIRYDIMHELASDSDDTEVAMRQIFVARMKAGQERFEEEQKSKISVKTKQQEIKTISKAPKFNHKEIEWLYSNGLYIGEEKLNKILSLPKDSLIQDLELVLQDSIDRYGYFNKFVVENEWEEEKMNFVVHAIYLLGELEATDSLDIIFNVLSQSDEYFELYLGDFLTSMIWEPVYKMASNNLEACKKFIFKPGIDTYARTTFPDMVEQLVLHHPERRDEALNWFAEIIHNAFQNIVIHLVRFHQWKTTFTKHNGYIKLFIKRKITCILPPEINVQTLFLGFFSSTLKLRRRQIDTNNMISPPGKLYRMPPGSTSHIQYS